MSTTSIDCNRLQLPQWFRVVTGAVQLIGATGLVAGYFNSHWAMIAGIWLALTMIGALLAHVRIKDSFMQMMAAIILFLPHDNLFCIAGYTMLLLTKSSMKPILLSNYSSFIF